MSVPSFKVIITTKNTQSNHPIMNIRITVVKSESSLTCLPEKKLNKQTCSAIFSHLHHSPELSAACLSPNQRLCSFDRQLTAETVNKITAHTLLLFRCCED